MTKTKRRSDYARAVTAHNIATFLDVPFGDAWQVVTCLDKTGWDDREDAERNAQKWNQQVYRCPVCGRWHCSTRKEWDEDGEPD